MVGTEIAHQLTYRFVAPDHEARERLLEETGHAYMTYLPLAMALCAVAVVSALVAEAFRGRSSERAGMSIWFGLIAPSVFVCQEFTERLAHDGAVSAEFVTEPTFRAGMLIQIPFVLAAVAVAWVLLRVAHAVGRLVVVPVLDVGRSAQMRAQRPNAAAPPRLSALAFGCGTRGPPSLALT